MFNRTADVRIWSENAVSVRVFLTQIFIFAIFMYLKQILYFFMAASGRLLCPPDGALCDEPP
jgi:hypothetical protein